MRLTAVLTTYAKSDDLDAKTADLMLIASKTADLTTLVRIACILFIVVILILAILI